MIDPRTEPVIGVAVVEDDARYAEALRRLLDTSPGLECIAAFGSVEEAERELARSSPDVVLLDIHLPGLSGIEGAARLRERVPTARIVMLTVCDDYDEVFAALKAGADGYLLKSAPPARIIDGLREVVAGGAPLSAPIARLLVREFRNPGVGSDSVPEAQLTMRQLTDREREIIELVSGGQSYKQVAARLRISERTVESHARSIYRKLHARGKKDAVARWKDRREKRPL